MRRRLLASMLLVATVAVAGFGIPLALSVRATYRDEALLSLSDEASRAAVVIPPSYARDNDIPELPDPAPDTDVGLYDTDGRRVVGTGPATADPAVTEALTGATGRQQGNDLVVAIPVSENEQVVGAIRTSQPGSVVAWRTARTWLAMAALAAVILAATSLLAARRSRTLAQPLSQLRDDADVIGAGGEVPAREATGIDEIDEIHSAITDAATRLNETLVRERAFGADLAHQLRTPITSLRLRLETIQLNLGPDGDQITAPLSDLDRLQQTIDDLLLLTRDTEPTREPHPLGTMLRQAHERWAPQITEHGRGLELDIERSLPWTDASPSAVRQILDVLLDNALKHGAGAVELAARRVGNGAVITISDHGTSVLDATQAFVRRSDGAAGTGIGLALAKRLAEAEDVRLILADPGPGVTFHLVFGGLRTRGRDATSARRDQAS